MNVTLRQLRVFLSVAQRSNFSRAGDHIGLTQPAISRAIVESHGGQLWVDSQPGAGASFHFTLPFAE